MLPDLRKRILTCKNIVDCGVDSAESRLDFLHNEDSLLYNGFDILVMYINTKCN